MKPFETLYFHRKFILTYENYKKLNTTGNKD